MTRTTFLKTARVVLTVLGCSLTFAAFASDSDEQIADPNFPKITPQIEALHDRAFVFDAHADVLLPTDRQKDSKVSLEKLEKGGVDAVVLSLTGSYHPRTPEGDAQSRAIVDQKYDLIMQMLADNADSMVLATSYDELIAAHQTGKVAVMIDFLNVRAFEGRVDAVDEFYEKGVRIIGLNHIGHNDFADSSRPEFMSSLQDFEPKEIHGGLSDLGVATIKRMNDLGILINVSQSSDAAALQMIQLSRAPVIASHSNARALSDVTRNLPDELIDAIGENGGVVHVTAFGSYLPDISSPETRAKIAQLRKESNLPEYYTFPNEGYWVMESYDDQMAFLMTMRDIVGPASLDRLLDHIDYIVGRIGVDHLGFGNDFNHGGGAIGFYDSSEAMNLTAGLVARGYSESDIEKILGGNFLRVLKAAEEAAKK